VNSPEQHLVAQEFDRAYPLLHGLTPESLTLTNQSEWATALDKPGLPAFVRGSVRSGKAAGLKACVAQTPSDLQALIDQFFKLEYRSRGKVIVRELVSLKHHRFSDEGFPLGREYRVFAYKGKILAYGYYWEGEDPLKALTPSEEKSVIDLASEIARRLGVPFLAVDVGQLVSGEWIAIEVNDAQFAGTCQVPLLNLWNAILSVE
jgi:hypothetical protein